MRTFVLAGLVALIAPACGSTSRFTDPPDTGSEVDAGGGAIDAGGGAVDAGRGDAGLARDAGATIDAGATVDAGSVGAGDAAVGVCMARDLGSAVGRAVATGTNADAAGSSEGSCGGDAAAESAVLWTAPADGDFTFSTEGTDFDTVLYVNDGACAGTELDCNDDEPGNDELWSSVTVTLRRGQRVVVFVDGYDGESGPWTLNITAE